MLCFLRKLVCVVGLGFAMSSGSLFAQSPFNRNAPQYTATPDGVITAAEQAGMLSFPLSFSTPEGAQIGPGSPASATVYVSWDASNLYISADVINDTTLGYNQPAVGPLNQSDVFQPTFSPNNAGGPFAPTGDGTSPVGGPIIYDIAVQTSDSAGPSIWGHGPPSASTTAGAVVGGTDNAAGYVVEASIPWTSAMGGAYTPTVGDMHGLSFILVDYDGGNLQALFTDFGNGSITIGNASTWNKVTLAVPEPAGLSIMGALSGVLLLARRVRR